MNSKVRESNTDWLRRGEPPASKVPRLIDALKVQTGLRHGQAHKELVTLTGQDFGHDLGAWEKWFEMNGSRFRHEWAAAALERAGYEVWGRGFQAVPACIRALRSEHLGERAAASYLLKCLTGKHIPFPLHSSSRTRERMIKKWTDWWFTGAGGYLAPERSRS